MSSGGGLRVGFHCSQRSQPLEFDLLRRADDLEMVPFCDRQQVFHVGGSSARNATSAISSNSCSNPPRDTITPPLQVAMLDSRRYGPFPWARGRMYQHGLEAFAHPRRHKALPLRACVCEGVVQRLPPEPLFNEAVTPAAIRLCLLLTPSTLSTLTLDRPDR
jgi:hypothetical protein